MTASNTSIKGLEQLIKDEVWKPYTLKVWTLEEINNMKGSELINFITQQKELDKCYRRNGAILDNFMDNNKSFETYVDIIMKPFPHEDTFNVVKMCYMDKLTRKKITDSYTKCNKINYLMNKKILEGVDLEDLLLKKIKKEKLLKEGILTKEQEEAAARKQEQLRQQKAAKTREWRAANPNQVKIHTLTATLKKEAARQIDDSMSIEEISRRIVRGAIDKALKNVAVAACRAKRPDVLCECGEMIKFYTQEQHRQSKKHKTKVNNLLIGVPLL